MLFKKTGSIESMAENKISKSMKMLKIYKTTEKIILQKTVFYILIIEKC